MQEQYLGCSDGEDSYGQKETAHFASHEDCLSAVWEWKWHACTHHVRTTKNDLGKAKQTTLQPKMRIRKAEEAKRFDNEILHDSRLIPQVWVDSQPSTGMQTDDWQGIGRSDVMLKSQAFTALIDTAGLDKTCVSLGQQPLPMRHVWTSVLHDRSRTSYQLELHVLGVLQAQTWKETWTPAKEHTANLCYVKVAVPR